LQARTSYTCRETILCDSDATLDSGGQGNLYK
jgi:hypothetical protein